MKHTKKQQSDTKLQFTVSVTADELQEAKKGVLKRLAKEVNVDGFRQGKAPLEVAEKNLDSKYVNSETLQEAINAAAIAVFGEEKILPLDRPNVDVKKFVPEQELEFTIDVEVMPKVKLGDYKNLKAKKKVDAVNDSEVDEALEGIRKNAAVKKDVERAAKKGDVVVIDFEGKDKDGNIVEGAVSQDYSLELGSNSFIPGFEEGLVGKKIGDSLELPLTFPKDYHHKPLAGQKIVFAVTVKKVQEEGLPKLDAKFAESIGPFKTVEDLKNDIKRELTQQKDRESDTKFRNELLEELLKSSQVPISKVLVDDQMRNLEQEFMQNLTYRGMTLEQYLEQLKMTKEEWQDKELRKQAEQRVLIGLLLSELSQAEKIKATEKDLEDKLDQLKNEYGSAPEILKQLEKAEIRRDLENKIVIDKTVGRLVELNTKK